MNGPFADKYIRKSDSVAARYLGEELIIMSAVDSMLFSLNSCAAAIWDAADGRSTLAQLVQTYICTGFDVDPQEALDDAEELMAELLNCGMVIVCDHPCPAVEESKR